MTAAMPPEEFEQHVRDCLAHLYDYPFLQGHPIVQKLVPDVTLTNRVQAFRQLVLDTVERLRPVGDVSFHAKPARHYHILVMRYVEEYSTSEVMAQLALSERQFYRDHRKAVQAISQLLWSRVAEAPHVNPGMGASITVQSEIQRMRNHSAEIAVDLDELLQGTLTATRSLAEQHQTTLVYDPPNLSDPVALEANRTVLRQAVIDISSQLIMNGSQGNELHLSYTINRGQCQIMFTVRDKGIDASTLQALVKLRASLQALLDTLNSSHRYEQIAPGVSRLILAIPLNPQTILVIDDNPDVIDLFRRYLADQAYHLVGAKEGKEGIRLAQEVQPRMIILDVMLPGQDGWEVLHHLKFNPATAHIPVMVCSVLDAPDLATSLGADGYLKKPPGRVEFLTALERWLA